MEQFFNPEGEPKVEIQIESEFADFVPTEFLADPLKYFEEKGINIKSGETQYDENGAVREDPDAVKRFPLWENGAGESIEVVAKKINVTKAEIGKSENPFYEYEIIEKVRGRGLPAPEPILKARTGNENLFVVKKAGGINWFEKNSVDWTAKGFSDFDIENLQREAEEKMKELETKFIQAGVIRKWKLKDIVFDIDFENKAIKSITPTDWERTKIVEG